LLVSRGTARRAPTDIVNNLPGTVNQVVSNRKGNVKKFSSIIILLSIVGIALSGCGQESGQGVVKESVVSLEKVDVAEGDPMVYLNVAVVEASSFDLTPDWAPEPNSMAIVDGDMLTRWSSDYIEEEQWVYCDFGKECVVSNVIIRWERAHATNYKILVSNDSKNWQEVYHEKSSKGGLQEAFFAPVKCRYVKILGLERVNEDWGISIWEVEIYGPKAHNDSDILKQNYLKKGEDEEKTKEAKELLKEYAASVIPFSEKGFQKGVVYTSWMTDEFLSPSSDIMLVYIKSIGYDTVAVMVPAYQADLDSTDIFVNDAEGGDTPSLEALEHVIASCHTLGLRVVLKPHVDPRTDEPRINIMPSEGWFNSYEKFVVKYAKFAQENNVEMYSIGTELEATTFDAWAGRWNQVIDKIKEVYDGLLTYSANWTEYKEVPFWDRMDYIGLDAYFPLTNSNEVELSELIDSWDGISADIEKWLIEKGLIDKGIILSEIGYPSADGANVQPWVATTNVEDQQEQADCLEATLEALSKRSWFQGYYIWQYFPQERWSPLGFTIKGKKAEEVLKKWLKK